MDVVGTLPSSGATSPSQPASSKLLDTGSKVMGKDDFLRLLVTQLSNQDPLNPMDGQQFAAQLAQFSSVEQLINMSEAMATQSEMSGLISQNINTGVATGLIGKEIVAESNQVTLTDGGQPPIGFDLKGTATEVTIAIKNASGNVIRTIEVGSLTEGTHEVVWDGKNEDGVRESAGSYTFEVQAKDKQGDGVDYSPRMTGRVDRVSFGPDGIQIWMGNTSVSLGAVVSVQQAG